MSVLGMLAMRIFYEVQKTFRKFREALGTSVNFDLFIDLLEALETTRATKCHIISPTLGTSW